MQPVGAPPMDGAALEGELWLHVSEARRGQKTMQLELSELMDWFGHSLGLDHFGGKYKVWLHFLHGSLGFMMSGYFFTFGLWTSFSWQLTGLVTFLGQSTQEVRPRIQPSEMGPVSEIAPKLKEAPRQILPPERASNPQIGD